MDRNDHVCSLVCSTGGSIQTLAKGIKAKEVEQDVIQPNPKWRRSKVIKQVPRPGIGSHALIPSHIVVVRVDGTIIRVNVDNVTLNVVLGELHLQGVAERIRGCPVPTTRIAHENLNGVYIIIFRCEECTTLVVESRPRNDALESRCRCCCHGEGKDRRADKQHKKQLLNPAWKWWVSCKHHDGKGVAVQMMVVGQ